MKKRNSGASLFPVMLFFLVIIFTFTFDTGILFAQGGSPAAPTAPSVAIPNVVGMTIDKAGAALSQSGLSPNVRASLSTCIQSQNNTVAFQSPAAGTQSPRGQAVQLILFTFDPKQQTAVVPNLVGMPLAQAGSALSQSGLSPQPMSLPTGNQSQNGAVAFQNPQAGAQVNKGQPVQLIVFQFDPKLQTIAVPKVTGMPMAQAGPALSQAALTPQVMSPILTGNQSQNGTVAFQNPQAGAQVNKGQPVQLIVFQFDSKLQIFTVPNVTGMPMSQAPSVLNQARINFRVTGSRTTNIQGQGGRVASQNPAAGAQISPGQIVDLVVFQYVPKKKSIWGF